MFKQSAMGLFASVMLTACGSVDGSDPRTGGFLGGIKGIQSGSYDARITALEAELARLERRNATDTAELRRINARKATIQAELNQLRRDDR